jgi:hypothetical protein
MGPDPRSTGSNYTGPTGQGGTMKIHVKMKVPPLKKFKYTGKYRRARRGEYVLEFFAQVPQKVTVSRTTHRYPILKKRRKR